MRYAPLVAAAALPLVTSVLGTPSGSSGDRVARTPAVKGEEPWEGPMRRWAEALNEAIRKRQTCGEDVGDCPDGECCSEAGYCGSTTAYCKSPQCQIAFSNGNCDADERPCGKSTEDTPRHNDGEAPYGQYIKTCTEDNAIALTFDDGPYLYTNTLLDLLRKYDARATFFVTGNNIGKGRIDDESTQWPTILRRIHAEGHQIASHTWSHEDLSAASDDRRHTEIIYNEMALRNVLGFFPTYLRPPRGTCTSDSGCLDLVTELGYHVVTWDLDTKDYANNTPDKIQTSKDIFDDGFNGTVSNIVLSHDSQKTTVEELAEYMLKAAKEKGFKTVTVGECLGDPEENWYIKSKIEDSCEISEKVQEPRDDAVSSKAKSGLTLSKDGTCGERSKNKYTCQGSDYGDCCSYNGFCGSTSGYCDGGCQTDFGKCNKWECGDELIVSENGLCGGYTFQTCRGSSYGDCCSTFGNCGSTDEYCSKDDGCQSDWGTCS